MKPSSQMEEPDWQWLEDAIVGLSGFVLAIVFTVITLVLNLVVAVFKPINRS